MDNFKKFLSQIGARIRAHRVALDLSIEDAALRSGIHPSFWSQIERAAKQPSLKSIHRMAAGLKTTPAELLDVTGAEVEVVDRELAILIKERPPKERSSLLGLLRNALAYWETKPDVKKKRPKQR